MATKTVFTDDNGNEMDLYQNDKGAVFISVGQVGENEIHSGYITLYKEDIVLLIKRLNELEKEM